MKGEATITRLKQARQSRDKQATGEILRDLMVELDWNVHDVSKIAGTQPETIRRWLRGEFLISFAKISKIAAVLPEEADYAHLFSLPFVEAVYALRKEIQPYPSLHTFRFLFEAEKRLGIKLDVETATRLLRIKFCNEPV